MSERLIVSLATAVCASAWANYFSVALQAESNTRALALAAGALMGLVPWLARVGDRELVFEPEVPRWERTMITCGIAFAGLVTGYVAPGSLGARELDGPLNLALALSCGSIAGYVAWRNPTLFYRNRE
jgi:hypothetical protein